MNLDEQGFGIGLEDELNISNLNVHIRITKRSGRKSITTIEGIPQLPTAKNLKLENLVKELRKKFSCNGSIKDGVISLQGDHRFDIRDILVKKELCKEEQIKIHGY